MYNDITETRRESGLNSRDASTLYPHNETHTGVAYIRETNHIGGHTNCNTYNWINTRGTPGPRDNHAKEDNVSGRGRHDSIFSNANMQTGLLVEFTYIGNWEEYITDDSRCNSRVDIIGWPILLTWILIQ